VEEYTAFIKKQTAKPGTESDRSNEENILYYANEPGRGGRDVSRVRRDSGARGGGVIGSISMPGLTAVQHYVVGLAYRLMALLFQTEDGSVLHITIQTKNGTLPGVGGGVVLGTAAMSMNGGESFGVITLYTDHLEDGTGATNANGMLAVLMHELFHVSGFGPLSGPGAISFTERSNDLTLEYNSTDVAACASPDRDEKQHPYVRVDKALAHWAESATVLANDLMQPTIDFLRVVLSRCTLVAIQESRPLWTTGACTRDSDCTRGQRCGYIGKRWGSVCVPPLAVDDGAKPTDVHVFASIVFVLSFFFICFALCYQINAET